MTTSQSTGPRTRGSVRLSCYASVLFVFLKDIVCQIAATSSSAVRIRDVGSAIITNVSAGESGTTEIADSMKEAIKQMKNAAQSVYVCFFDVFMSFFRHNKWLN